MTDVPSRQPAPPPAPAHEAVPKSSPLSMPYSAAFGHGEPVRRTDRGYIVKLSIAAVGVVYGDIGTSPLYALRECFHGPHAIPITRGNVLGVLSLMIWSLLLIVTAKYLLVVLRADNKGEGGILALMALVMQKLKARALRPIVVACGIFGAALLYGDGAITPAITVLSAIEGLSIALPEISTLVAGVITSVILLCLFAIQKRGTGGIGIVFGPVMLIWFVVLALLGLDHIRDDFGVLASVLPTYAVSFFWENGVHGTIVLGSVFLVVTGGEALYADLGHFGRKPIQVAWLALVLPSLILNYFGQGAFLLTHPDAAKHPFFLMAPAGLLYPLVALATAASIIASQALISGAFSLTRQATMLGLLPRMSVLHTSADERGQIYVPAMNWMLMLAAVGLVIGFETSSRLASAYGIAVSLTMVITTLLVATYARIGWNWPKKRVVWVTLLVLVPELAFLAANMTKIRQGGWFALALGVFLFVIMTTWQRGRQILAQRFREQLLPLADFFELMHVERPARVPGTAVFMSSADGTPPALLRNFMHNRVLHQEVVLLTVTMLESPRASEHERISVEHLDHGFCRVIGRYGFMEQPNAPDLLTRAGVMPSVEHTTFFLGRENFIAAGKRGMAKWRIHLFAALSRNAQSATKFFGIPPDRVMEIGAQIEL
jgi:KUP system potassium uptake protein